MDQLNAGSCGVFLFVTLCLPAQAIPFVHRFLLLITQFYIAGIDFHFIEHAAVPCPHVQHPDLGSVEAIGGGLSIIRTETCAAVAYGPSVIRLILDLGIEAVGVHLRYHTGESDQIRVLFVVGSDELGPDLDAAFQVGKALDL